MSAMTNLERAVVDVLDVYRKVATGETRGAGGHFAADGQGTLNAVTVPVELLEHLAIAAGTTVYPRARSFRERG